MENQQSTATSTNPSLLSRLVHELNKARRNFRSYPSDHPIIEASFTKVIDIYERLLVEKCDVVIGVARDALMVNEGVLDKNNLVFRDFAKVLYEHGIGALCFHRGLSKEELRNFNSIMNLKREELQKQGGIAAVWEKSNISALEIKVIRYDVFNVIENSSEASENDELPMQSLWERFAQGLVRGTLEDSGSKDGEIDPRELAAILNRQMGTENQGDAPAITDDAISAFLEFPLNNSRNDASSSLPYDNLAIFINHLNPEIRRLFLSKTFEVNNTTGGLLAEELIPRLSTETVLETLEDISHEHLKAPPVLMRLLQKMILNNDERKTQEQLDLESEADIHNKIRSIFREHDAEDFVPDAYRKTLDRIIVNEQTQRLEKAVVIDLMETLDSHWIEYHISELILIIITLDDDPKHTDLLVNNLSEMYFYLLQTGDYDQLIRLIEQSASPEIPEAVRNRLRKNYTSKECLTEMLVGLTTWGKTKYDDITSLIRLIGKPFIEVLLNQLAVEENISLRRFLTDRIQEFGHEAKDAIIDRLSDHRWFVLRNLVIMLRGLDDISVLDHIHPLLHNSNHRVRQETLRTFIHFHDPAAERQLLHDMDSLDRETQMSAIHLAEKSRSSDVYKKLISIISKSGFNTIECEIKSAVIHALAEIGRAEALPELAKVLASKSLLHSRALTKLKIDIVRSLGNYPSTVARPILEKLAAGSGEIARQALTSLKSLPGKAS